MEKESLRGAVALSHFFLRGRVRPGDRVADATCGNGRDTLLLARLVGPGWYECRHGRQPDRPARGRD